MPDFILDEYAAGRMSGEFQAVALFVDASGFSAMTDTLMQHGQHGAEVLASVMRAAFAPLIQSVFEQNGFIAIQAGDAFTAIFPLAENPAVVTRRALARPGKSSRWQLPTPSTAHPMAISRSLSRSGCRSGRSAGVSKVRIRQAGDLLFQGERD
jgi:class 3 adenylate cyclase